MGAAFFFPAAVPCDLDVKVTLFSTRGQITIRWWWGGMRGVLLWPFKNPCFKDKRNSGDEVLTESQGGWSYLKYDWEGKIVSNASACSAGEHWFFWSSSWPSVLKARTFELKSKTCKLLENSLVDDQYLVWSGSLSPSSTSSRWCLDPRFESKLFPQADTGALHLGIKGSVGPATFYLHL